MSTLVSEFLPKLINKNVIWFRLFLSYSIQVINK